MARQPAERIDPGGEHARRPGPAPATGELVARLRQAGCVRAEEEAALLTAQAADDDTLERLVARRAAGEPLEHVVGWAEFLGLRVRVGPGVFVPRRRTEALALEARRLLAERRGRGLGGDQRPGEQPGAPDEQRAGPGQLRMAPRSEGLPRAVVVDVCCGSGALGLAVAVAHDLELHASDVDPAAVACARDNLEGVGGSVHEGDLFDALPDRLRGHVDVLLANVPYVPTDHLDLLPAEARDHEARVALDGGPDGLDVLRRVAAAAPAWLRAGGHLLSEVSDRQAADALGVLASRGLRARAVPGDGGVVVVGTALPSARADPRVRPAPA
nr:methyltransferase [uncultured Actinotalea sp.]